MQLQNLAWAYKLNTVKLNMIDLEGDGVSPHTTEESRI